MAQVTILLADHEPTQRQLIDMLLALDNYQIVSVDSGRRVLEYLRENTPDLAILDIELPDLSGADICEKMRNISRLANVPVILTAPGGRQQGLDERTKALARLVGADLLLQKPLGDKNLRGRVRQLLERRHERRRDDRPGVKTTQVLEDTLDSLEGQAATPPASAANPTGRKAAGVAPDGTPPPRAERPGAAQPAARRDTGMQATTAAAERQQPATDELEATIAELRRENELLVSRIELLQHENASLKRELARREARAALQEDESEPDATQPSAGTRPPSGPTREAHDADSVSPGDKASLQEQLQAQARELAELRKRNSLLLEAIQQLKSEKAPPRRFGFFRRR